MGYFLFHRSERRGAQTMKHAIIINIITLMTYSLMKAAWELAAEGQKAHGGKKAEYLGEAMRQAWAVKKAGCTQEAALAAGGYELNQRQKDGAKEIKKQTALAAQKETRNTASDMSVTDEYAAFMATQPATNTAALIMDAPSCEGRLSGKAKADTFAALKSTLGNLKQIEKQETQIDEFVQESYDDECASQDESDYLKACSGCGKDFNTESLVTRMKKTSMGHKYLSYCPVCVARHDTQDKLFNTKVQYRKDLKPTYTRNRANWI